MLVVLLVHMCDATPHVCHVWLFPLCQWGHWGRRLRQLYASQSYARQRHRGGNIRWDCKFMQRCTTPSWRLPRKWRTGRIALRTYVQCAHLNVFMCIVHIICNVHCPLRTDSAYRRRFAGNIIRVESTEALLAFQNPLKCLWCHTLAILLDVINSYGQLAIGKIDL